MDPAELVDSYLNRLDDMRFVLDQILAEDDREGSPFHRKLDPRRIGMSGHSFGGSTRSASRPPSRASAPRWRSPPRAPLSAAAASRSRP